MEKSIDSFVEYLKEEFQLEDQDLRTYSPLTLAYIGDSIFDLVIRTLLVKHGNCPPQKLHERASKLVKASAQAEMIENLMPVLSEEEITIYKRGRNAKSYTKAKNATVADYRKATGLEALMGYLYLKEDTKRIIELIKTGLDMAESQERKVRNRHEIRRTYHRRQKCRAGSIPLRQNDRQTVCTGRLSGRSGENDPAGSQKT